VAQEEDRPHRAALAAAQQKLPAPAISAGAGGDIDPILQRLLRLHPKLIDLSLDRVRRLLAALGEPQLRLPPAIHVAGTNGKGSTIAFLRACLEAAGFSVHAFTKPHLIRFNERIRLAGRLIDDADLAALLEECEHANGGAPITYFEITTAAAFLAFARRPADILLLETGLGGRFDATNVIARPALAAITPISLDHQHFLGETVAAIAGEKAGILKPGRPAVLAPQPEAARLVLTARAEALGAPLFAAGSDWQARATPEGMRYEGRRWPRLDLPKPGLIGAHQIENAGTALACLDRLEEVAVDAAALARGLETVAWPARLQRLSQGRLAALLPPGAELWLDGGHNAGGGVALAAMAQAWREKPLRLVFGMLKSHDARSFLAPLAPFAASLAALAIPGEANALPAEEAASAARAVGIAAEPAAGIAAAVACAGGHAPPGRVLICGSLYLAGHVLTENGSQPVA
jgi:dihydrofolate synthase / folylpolyglutamate synthase